MYTVTFDGTAATLVTHCGPKPSLNIAVQQPFVTGRRM
jgi:hypothetical protein